MPARYAGVDSADLLGGRAEPIRMGYAAREPAECRVEEKDCGETVKPFHACCPKNTVCTSPDYNAHCCEKGKDCTSQVKLNPQCANPEHDLYEHDGWFCCEQERKGYANKISNGDGCGREDYELKAGDEWLTIAISGKRTSTDSTPSATASGDKSKTTDASATNTSATGTADPSTTGTLDPSSATPTAPNGSSTPTLGATATAPSAGAPSSTDAATSKTANTGAIAGGVVGGIAALAIIAVLLWFLRRRKARTYASTTPESPSGAYHAVEEQGAEKGVPLAAMGKASSQKGGAGEAGLSELPVKDRGGDARAAELYSPGGAAYSPAPSGAAELYSPAASTTAELHGVERGPGELPAWDGRGVPAQLKVGDGRPGPVELP